MTLLEAKSISNKTKIHILRLETTASIKELKNNYLTNLPSNNIIEWLINLYFCSKIQEMPRTGYPKNTSENYQIRASLKLA